MFGNIGMPEFIVILVIVVIIFGHDKVPEVGNIIGKAIRGFKKEINAPQEKLDKPEPFKSTEEKE